MFHKSTLVYFTTLLLMTSCSGGSSTQDIINGIEDIEGKKLTCMTGSVQEFHISRDYPENEKLIMSDASDVILSLIQKKADIGFYSSLDTDMILREHPEIACVCDTLHPSPIGFAFTRGEEALVEDFNRFLAEYSSTEEYREMIREWEDPDAS